LKYSKISNSIGSFFILIVFSVFAICSLLLVVIGSNAYGSIVSKIEENNQTRASLNYITNKIRQNDESGAINVVSLEKLDVITIDQTILKEDYITYIYYFDGYLNELFLKSNSDFIPQDGTKIVSVSTFDVNKQDNMLYINVSGLHQNLIEYKLCLESDK